MSTSMRPAPLAKSLSGSFPFDMARWPTTAKRRTSCLLSAFNECLNGFVEVLWRIEDKVRTLLVNEVTPRFVGHSKVFQPIGNHSGHACFLNLSVGSVNEVGLFDTRFKFEANTDGA